MQNAHCEQTHRHGNGHVRGHKLAKGNGKTAVEACPYFCQTDEVIPILYGMPTHAAFLKADGGEVYARA